jgi:hypothetical protein
MVICEYRIGGGKLVGRWIVNCAGRMTAKWIKQLLNQLKSRDSEEVDGEEVAVDGCG